MRAKASYWQRIVSGTLLLMLSAWTAQAQEKGPVRAVPEIPSFLQQDKDGEYFLYLYAVEALQIETIEQVALFDEDTGRPGLPKTFDSLALKRQLDPNRLERFSLRLSPEWKPTGQRYKGVLAVTFSKPPPGSSNGARNAAGGTTTSTNDTGPQKTYNTVTIEFKLYVGAVRPTLDDAKSADLTILAPSGSPAKLALGKTTSLNVCVAAVKGPIQVDAVTVELTDKDTKEPLDVGSIRFSIPKPLSPNQQECLEANLPSDSWPGVVSANGQVAIRYHGVGTGVSGVKTWNFEIARPAVDFRIGFNQQIRLEDTRNIPFLRKPICKKVVYRVTPVRATLPVGLSLSTEVETLAGATGVQPQGSSLTAEVLPGNRIELCADLPFGLTALHGRVWIQPPLTAKEVEFNPIFLVKDHVGWRALATVLAYALALVVTVGFTQARRRALHQIAHSQLSGRLDAFLKSNPGLSTHDSVVFIQQLLVNSQLHAKAGEFDLSDQDRAAALSRLETLLASPPPMPSVPNAAGADAIRVLEPEEERVAGHSLSLVIAKPNPDWKNTDTYEWFVQFKAQPALKVALGINKTEIRHLFRQPGPYTIVVTAANVSESRQLTIARRSAFKRLSRRLQAMNVAPLLIAAVLSAGAAYVATANADHWGTFGDYLTLFAAAFGVSSGTQAINTIIAMLRRP